MYKNRAENGQNNICGSKIKQYRLALPGSISQRRLADILQMEGLDLDKNAIQRIESGQQFITDIEIKVFAKVLHVGYEELLD